MKTKLFFVFLTYLFIATLFLCNSFAQDYTTWHLPEGAKARLGKGKVKNVAYSPDGNTIAVAAGIGIWLYDLQTYQELSLLTGHSGSVDSVAFSPNGQTLASGSLDETIRLWDVATGEHKKTLQGHADWVRSVVFSPDGQTLASGSSDGTVLLWHITSTTTKHP